MNSPNLAHKIFATDEEVLAEAFIRFKDETSCLAQEIPSSEGRFVFGAVHVFLTAGDLKRWTWKQPTTLMFALVIITPFSERLVYRGKVFTMTFDDYRRSPRRDFYERNDVVIYERPYNESELRIAAQQIRTSLKAS
ncbi:hypothetical protein WDW86_03645 [Bdellovibrionota bacterium FG-2]